ncbi:hypothetical protein JTP46_26765, partial [Escherichia coli]|nr:hypothetical protein [Escherichia coli]
LHRLSVVQGMLKHIDFSTASPTVRLALQKGTGAGNISALNKVMKGTLVTSEPPRESWRLNFLRKR